MIPLYTLCSSIVTGYEWKTVFSYIPEFICVFIHGKISINEVLKKKLYLRHRIGRAFSVRQTNTFANEQ